MSETSDVLKVHVEHAAISSYELIPPHAPRENTPEYEAAHRHLVYGLDTPCLKCGVRRSTLGDADQNPFGAKDIETHHKHIMRSLADACDPAKVAKSFPDAGIVDQASLLRWIDSEANLIVLCDVHHRSTHYGIHHVPTEVFFAEQWFWDGWRAVAETASETASATQADEQIAAQHHLEDPQP